MREWATVALWRLLLIALVPAILVGLVLGGALVGLGEFGRIVHRWWVDAAES